MTKDELTIKIAQLSGVPKTGVAKVLKTASAVISTALKDGAEVSLTGIGKLSVAERAARSGRNPKTGATITIPAKKVPHFSAAKALKDAVA